MRYVKEREEWEVPRRKNVYNNSVVRSVAIPAPGAIYTANPRTFLTYVSSSRQVFG